jgi:hypothetical protein
MAIPVPTVERRLLSELGALADRIRVLRAEGHPNGEHIKPLEAQTSLKWQELRLLRAGPINSDQFPPELGLPNRRPPKTITALPGDPSQTPAAQARAAHVRAALPLILPASIPAPSLLPTRLRAALTPLDPAAPRPDA